MKFLKGFLDPSMLHIIIILMIFGAISWELLTLGVSSIINLISYLWGLI